MTDPLVGAAVAHYEVLARLGGGGMGVVYTARNTRLGQVVALKFLPPQWSHDESARQRFIREAQAASATQHRNICTIHDIETTADGRLFIVMAYYDGQTLKQKLEGGALPVEEAVEIAGQIAEGLAKAHGEGVVHRDIKPGNLMLVDGDIKILDFGLAKFANSLQLTIEGSTLGTVAYMSPEQTRGDDADARSDIWAAGVVLFEMLTGSLPFKGAYAEAISHAIRNDAVPPLAAPGRDIPPELARIVHRALSKDPATRHQTAREFARDLRMLQGRTIPIDLLATTPIPAPPLQLHVPSPRRWWRSRAASTAAAVFAVAAVALPVWIFTPVERVPVAVAPVVNQTGYTELDEYRAALTQELVAELAHSSAVRVLAYDRELQILRRFRAGGLDVSSREATQALAANSGARIIIVPTLVYENGGWRARVEFRDAATATNNAVAETPVVVSSLPKDTAHGLMPQLAGAIEGHFLETGSTRGRAAHALRRLAGRADPAAQPSMRTLDAAADFERGLDQLEQLEYSAALKSLDQAAMQDPRNAWLLAWRSLVAHIMRLDDESTATGEQALGALTERTSAEHRLFVEAVAAESRRDTQTADARLRALVDQHPDDPAAVMLLASFQDRQNQNTEAVVTYLKALVLDPRLVRPSVELCRMYNRLNEAAKAKEYAQKALTASQALGARNGEGQALFCLADALRGGSDADREQARRHAESAIDIFTSLQAPYNLARAYNYAATIAGMQDRVAESAAFGEKALAAARTAGNIVLQPLVMMNLGVTYESLGDRARAADYSRQSARLYESLGDETRAAQIQTNRAYLLVTYGANTSEAVRDAENALAVFRKVGDKRFEIKALQVIAAAHRNSGRHADAERELNRAIAVARERDFKDDLAESTIDLAASRFELGDFAAVLELLTKSLGDGSEAFAPDARVLLGRTMTRLGDFGGARMALAQAAEEAAQLEDKGVSVSIETAYGELAYEAGNLREARQHFERAAARWTDDLPDRDSVQARAYLALLDALDGRVEQARRGVTASLDHARQTGWVTLEVRCRVFLARIEMTARRFDAALAALREITPEAERASGPELEAHEHNWRGRALERSNRPEEAVKELDAARVTLDRLRAGVPDRYRRSFESRPDIRLLGSTTS